MADRPGFMMYFDFAPALSRLTNEEAGMLFKAIMDYASTGAAYELPGICGFAFEVIRPRIDKDRESYEEKCRRNSYSTYVREAKKKNETPMDYESWRERTSNDIERYQAISDDNERYPTTTQLQLNSTTNQPNSTTTTTEIKEQHRSGPITNPTVAAVLSDYMNRINPAASPFCLEELGGYAEDLGEAVCKRAFDIALDNKKTTWPYIRAILQDKLARGVKCLADWDALEEARKASNSKKGGITHEGLGGNSGKAPIGNII